MKIERIQMQPAIRVFHLTMRVDSTTEWHPRKNILLKNKNKNKLKWANSGVSLIWAEKCPESPSKRGPVMIFLAHRIKPNISPAGHCSAESVLEPNLGKLSPKSFICIEVSFSLSNFFFFLV